VDKYSPASLDNFIGNSKQVTVLLKWLKGFRVHSKKCVIVYGPVGVGKSTAVRLAALSVGYHVVELSAADRSTPKSLQGLLEGTPLCSSCAVIEDLDGQSTWSYGTAQALVDSVKSGQFPVVCVCNNLYDTKLSTFRKNKLVLEVRFTAPPPEDLVRHVHEICRREGMSLTKQQYTVLERESRGDIRSVLNTLQLYSGSGIAHIPTKDALQLDTLSTVRQLLMATGVDVPLDERIHGFMDHYNAMPDYVYSHLSFCGDFKAWCGALDSMASGNELSSFMHETAAWYVLPAVGVCTSILPAYLVPQTSVSAQTPLISYDMSNRERRHMARLSCVSMECRGCSVPRSQFYGGVVELLLSKLHCGAVLSNLAETLGMTPDDITELHEIVEFDRGGRAQDSKSLQEFARMFNSSHAHSGASMSPGSRHVDYYIHNKQTRRGSRRK
jgi:DNA polymerase III delta prime subunit